MAGEEGLALLLEVGLVGIQHAVEPWEQLLSTVVGVQDNWDAVAGGNGADVLGSCDGSGNRGFLVTVGNSLDPKSLAVTAPQGQNWLCLRRAHLSGKVGSTALGHLENQGAVLVTGSLESGHDRR